MSKTHEEMWKEMTDLFMGIVDENYKLRTAAREAVYEIQKLESDPDYGIAWEAQAILIKALGTSKQSVQEGWDV